MSLKFCSLASGSTGNCVFIASETTKILIDVGISTTRIDKAIKILGEKEDGFNVLLTHAHSDHIKDLPMFYSKHSPTVFTSYAFSKNVKSKANFDAKHLVEFGDNDFFIGDITVSPFQVSHDVPCLGYCFYHKGKKISMCTDLGTIGNKIIKNISDSDLVFIESNHDVNMLKANPNYCEWLKKRILSERGHLSNEVTADAILKIASAGVKQFILAHLSKENNYPELAFRQTAEALTKAGAVIGEDVNLEVAHPDKLSSFYDII